MVERFLHALETTRLTAAGLIGAFLSIVALRILLEGFSSPSGNGLFPVDPWTLVHYSAYFLALFFAFVCILGTALRDYAKALPVALFGLLVLLIPPTFDVIATGGQGASLVYLIVSPPELLRIFFSFFDFLSDTGATLGVRITLFFATLLFAVYIFLRTKNILRALVAGAAVYVTVFIFGSFPSVLYALSGTYVSGGSVFAFLQDAFYSSGLLRNTLPATLVPASTLITIETGFNALMAACFTLIATVLGLVIAYCHSAPTLRAHIRNFRPLRVLHALMLVGIGALLGYFMSGGYAYGWADLLTLTTLAVAWCAACYYAVVINDLEDEAIDAVSNKERPLVVRTLTRSQMHSAALCAFLLMLLAGWVSGYYSFFFLLSFTAAYYAYSASPLRLKRVPLFSSFIIGLAALSAVCAGFFHTIPFKESGIFPVSLVFGIVLFYTLFANFKDLKDLEGDASQGIATLATVIQKRFGTKAAFRSMGVLVALAFLLTPLFFAVPYLVHLAALCALLGYLACVLQPYREQLVFAVLFVFLVGAVLLSVIAK